MLRRLWLLAAINALIIAASWAFTHYYRVSLAGEWEAGGGVKYLLVQFHLAAENVLVTWYSSTLLLFASVMTLFCFAVDRRTAATRNPISFGWLLLSGVLLLLSADEVGSIHERLGMLPSLNLHGAEAAGWSRVLAVPIAAVAIFMAAFGFVRVRRAPWALVLLLLGVVCYAMNPILERTQMRLLATTFSKDSWQDHDLSLHVEEGAELFGALCFLSAGCAYLMRARPDASQPAGAASSVSEPLRVPLACLIKLLAGLFGALTISWWVIEATGFTSIEADKGKPENWYPSALAILCACASSLLRRALAPALRRERRSLAGVTVFFWCLAIYYGIWVKGGLEMDAFRALHLQTIVSIGWLAAAGMVAACLWQRADSWFRQAGVLAWFAMLAAGLMTGPEYAVDVFEVAAPAILLLVLVHELADGQQPAHGASAPR